MRRYALKARTAEEYIEAERIRKILVDVRKRKGLKQDDIANMLGLKQAAYSIIERDFKRTSTYRQEQICDILGLERPKIFKE